MPTSQRLHMITSIKVTKIKSFSWQRHSTLRRSELQKMPRRDMSSNKKSSRLIRKLLQKLKGGRHWRISRLHRYNNNMRTMINHCLTHLNVKALFIQKPLREVTKKTNKIKKHEFRLRNKIKMMQIC